MPQLTGLTCNSVVVPKPRLNRLMLTLLNYRFLPFYFLSKKLYPKFEGKVFGPMNLTMTVETTTTERVRQSNRTAAQSSDAQVMMDAMFDLRHIGVSGWKDGMIVPDLLPEQL